MKTDADPMLTAAAAAVLNSPLAQLLEDADQQLLRLAARGERPNALREANLVFRRAAGMLPVRLTIVLVDVGGTSRRPNGDRVVVHEVRARLGWPAWPEGDVAASAGQAILTMNVVDLARQVELAALACGPVERVVGRG